jgi:hypothetical protein
MASAKPKQVYFKRSALLAKKEPTKKKKQVGHHAGYRAAV